MVNCNDFRLLAGEFLEGAERPELAAHLSACPACRGLVEDLRAVATAASSLPVIVPDDDLWLTLRAQAEAEGLLKLEGTLDHMDSMDCEEFALYAGGVLEGERHPVAFEHLYRCAGCRDHLHELDAVARAARNLPAYLPRPQLWKRLRAAARAEDLWQEESWWERWLVPQPVLATGLAAATLVFGLVLVSVESAGVNRNAPERSFQDVARSEMISEKGYAARYHLHLLQVERAVLDEDAQVDDHLLALAEKPLDTVDRAIANTRRALSANPGDALMQDELNRLFRQKATVLAVMTDLTWQEYGE